MRKLVTPAEMAAADSLAIEGGTSADVLMERAGRAVARAVIELSGGRYRKRAVIACGKGNNGGDGFVVARVLEREGVAALCLAVGDVWSSQGAAKGNLDRWVEDGGRLLPFDERRLHGVDVIVDAIFGTGFHGRAEAAAARAIEAINAAPAPTIAIDIPSGVNGTSGTVEGPAVAATATVTMAAVKLGCAIGEGAAHAGRVEVADIGISVPEVDAHLVDGFDVARILPRRPPGAHKRSVGSVAVLAGSDEMPGAALLTARGAVRGGAGYVTLCTTGPVARASAQRSPEVLTRVAVEGPVLGPDALERAKDVLERADAVAIGPGLGRGSEQEALVRKALAEIEVPIVVDADGLNVLARSADALAEARSPVIITPHPAELARLLGARTTEVQSDRAGAARAAARRFECVVLLKGFRTVVADRSARLVVVGAGGPELATAGTGDVLAGCIAALVAARVEPFTAAWGGAHVHAIAGALAAVDRGPSGVAAWDVAEALGEAAEQITSLT